MALELVKYVPVMLFDEPTRFAYFLFLLTIASVPRVPYIVRISNIIVIL